MKNNSCSITVASSKTAKLSRFHFFTNTILIAFLSIILGSCANDDDNSPAKKEQQPVISNEISEEIKELIYFKGNEKASKVLVTIQGGPSPELPPDIVNLIAENTNIEDLLIITVHQAQTMNPTILEGENITLDQAVAFNAESIEMLYKVIRYFKDQGRTVDVFGISFGAFVTQELISKKGIDAADNYLIMTGRLDLNEMIWQWALEGIEGAFENGVTPIIVEDQDPDPGVVERNLGKISAGFAMNRYTQLLTTIEDLSNVTYIYGETDEALGSLTPEEIQFLESRNTNIIVGNGGHDDTFFEFLAQGLNEAFGIEQLQ